MRDLRSCVLVGAEVFDEIVNHDVLLLRGKLRAPVHHATDRAAPAFAVLSLHLDDGGVVTRQA